MAGTEAGIVIEPPRGSTIALRNRESCSKAGEESCESGPGKGEGVPW